VVSYRNSPKYLRCQLLTVSLKRKVEWSLVANAKPETKKVIVLNILCGIYTVLYINQIFCLSH